MVRGVFWLVLGVGIGSGFVIWVNFYFLSNSGGNLFIRYMFKLCMLCIFWKYFINFFFIKMYLVYEWNN